MITPIASKLAHSRAKRWAETMVEDMTLISGIRRPAKIQSLEAGKVIRNRKIAITVEKERLLVISQNNEQSWCEQCQATVKRIGPAQAAAIKGVSHRSIFQHIESGQLHFVEGSGGVLLICLEALFETELKTTKEGDTS
jgi:hypothetical protein